ncbi:hypothetical protein ACFVS2_20770 [Brevibacillus sp. NPDC058079]|uniref:hypothetical protein n=1 Tax=Brevibacillus sp. NPDC058079 TaxID=3346330 RepID=UPI0036EA8222
MITINYCVEGTPYSDFEAEAVVEQWFRNGGSSVYHVSTENVISFVRVMVAESKVSHTDVQIQYNGENLEMNEYAVFKKWAKGFCDFNNENATRIIKAQNAKRKSRRNK